MSYKLPSAHAEPINREEAFPLYYNDKSDALQGQNITDENIPKAVPFIPETYVVTVTKKRTFFISTIWIH
jgi:hypothetical protein